MTTIKVRRDTSANWTSINPVLNQGEPGLETDTGRFKYGDGSTAWTSLGYAAANPAAVNTFTADQRFGSGRPWFDVTASEFGADPTGTSDSTLAILTAINTASGLRTDTGVSMSGTSVTDAAAVAGDVGKYVNSPNYLAGCSLITAVTSSPVGYTVATGATASLTGQTVAIGTGSLVATRNALGPVYLPAGTYIIKSDIAITSVLGFQLITAGAEQVILKCTGHAFTNAALYINGADACVFSGFTIIGDGTEGTATSGSGGGIPNAIWLTWNPATAARSTSGNTLRNIRTRNLKSVTGVNISATTGAYQVDGSLVEDVLTTGGQTVGSWSGTGLYQYGFLIGNGAFGNQYDHTLINAGGGLWYYGYYCNVSGYQLYGAQPGGNYCDFYFNYPAAECTINGVQSQVAQMAVQGTASASGSKAVSFRDFYWDGYQSSAPPSDEIITITGDITSAWEFSSCFFLTGDSTYTPVISIDSTYGAAGVAATFINCSMANTPAAGIAVTGTNTTVVLVNYVELSASTGVPTASFPLYIYSGGSWSAGVSTPSVQWVTATGSYTWTQPSGAQTVDVLLCAGGAGGGSGAIQTTGNAGGGSGGSGGAMNFRSFVASDLPSSVGGSVGAGGAGGAAVSGTSAASGSAAAAGGSTTFSTYLDSYPGSAGQPGTTSGGAATGGQSTSGGMYQASASGAGGAAANGGATGTASGGTGGGGGGGSTSSTAYNGGASGYSTSGSTSNSGAGGVAGTSSPGTGTQPTVKGTPSCGGGGGGGANYATGGAIAQTGALAYYGGGGGGGGGAFIPAYSYTATSASPCVFTASGSAYANGAIVNVGSAGIPAGFVSTFSYTATSASPCVFTASGSALVNGQPVQLASAGIPTGFSATAVYYVVSVSGTSFSLAAAPAGSAINSTSTGSGTLTVYYYVVSASGTTFELAATSGGSAINSTSTGSGTVTTLMTSGAGGVGGNGFALVITHFA